MVGFFGAAAVSSLNIDCAISFVLIDLLLKHSQHVVAELVFNLRRLLERGGEEPILFLLHH